MPVSYRVNGLSCLFVRFLMLFSAFILYIIILIFSNMHACLFFFACFFFLAIHPSIHSSSIHFTTYLPFFLIYLRGLQKMRLWLGLQRIDSLTVSSKITFLYHPCFSIFRIFNKLNNITWKSILSATYSSFSCQRY